MQLPNLSTQFLINPDITYLNFGSFGACPKPVFEDYQKWQRELEYEAVQFITVTGPKYLENSRKALGQYVGCDADDLVFVPNPSYAINIVAKSFPLEPGDQILSTDIEYGACDRIWSYYCKKAGAQYVRQHINLPVVSKEQIVEDFFKGLSPATKAIYISQITSATSLILPIKEICAYAKSKGLITIVDGAHVPGHIPLNLSELEADVYTGACHKWMMTPKGSSFFYVKKEFQSLFDPLVISWGYESAAPSHSSFLDYHQMQGTRDFSAFLTIPKALEFMNAYDWTSVAARCRKIVQDNALRFCNLFNTQPICPVTDDFIGQIFSIPIKTNKPAELHQYFFDKYKIEIPVMKQDNDVYIRYSINAYNSQQDLDKLYDALVAILAETDFIQR